MLYKLLHQAKDTAASVPYSVVTNQVSKQLERIGTYYTSVDTHHTNESPLPLDKTRLGAVWMAIHADISQHVGPVRNGTLEEFVGNPHIVNFKKAETKRMLATEASAAGALLDKTVTNREVDSPSVLPSGEVIYKLASLQPAQVRTVEVSHCHSTAKELGTAVDIMRDYMSIQPGSSTEDEQEDDDLSEKARGKRPQRPMSTNEKSTAYHHLMTLISFDMTHYPIFFDPNVYNDPLARLDSQDVHELASLDTHGGLFWRYTITSPPAYKIVDDVEYMLHWALIRSPVMLETVDRVVGAVTTPALGGRVLVVVDSLVAQL